MTPREMSLVATNYVYMHGYQNITYHNTIGKKIQVTNSRSNDLAEPSAKPVTFGSYSHYPNVTCLALGSTRSFDLLLII